MKLDTSDIQDLKPVLVEVVRATIESMNTTEAKIGAKLGFTEPEAAALIGVQRHVLRDCRLRGEISARKVGSRFVYSRDTLLRFLADAGQ